MRVRKTSNVWLFAFADLAFLLLIAFTQIPDTRIQKIPLPKVPQAGGEKLTVTTATSLKLFIYETGENSDGGVSGDLSPGPFQLAVYRGAEKIEESKRMSEARLLKRLKDQYASGPSGPILWPNPGARAEDLLTAYVLIQQVWPDEEVVIAVTPRPGEKETGP